MTTVSLKCAEFQGILTTGLLSMFETEQFANVTIAVEGKFLKAHQIVLSIYSPYFNALLQSSPCKHPIIFIKGVKYNVMKHLLRFMYEGETEIAADDFKSFIQTARELQIKWLSKGNEHSNTDEASKNSANTSRAETNTKQLDHKPIKQEATDNNDTGRSFEVIEANHSNEEHIVKTTYEILGITNVNGNTTIAEGCTNTDTDMILVETIDKALDVEEMNGLKDDEHTSTNDREGVVELYDEDEDDELLEPMDHAPNDFQQQCMPPIRSPPEDDPVTVLFYEEGKTDKCFVDKYSYCKHYQCKAWSAWRCLHKHTCRCDAKLLLTNDNSIVFKKQHSHKPMGKVRAEKCIKQEIYHRTTVKFPGRKSLNTSKGDSAT